MTWEHLRTLGLWMVIALVAGGVSFLGYRWRAWRRQRHDTWRELCLRLELVAEPGDSRVASGKLQGFDFSLRDTGSSWLLEVSLPQLLLPPGVVLLSAKARELWPNVIKLRRLRLSRFSASPSPFAWYAGRDTTHAKVDPSEAFLEEARRAMEVHAPLRVELHRLFLVLRTGSQVSVDEVREAVRALEVTARRWLEAVERHGLPRVEAPPRAPSAPWRLPRVPAWLHKVFYVLGGLGALFFCCCLPICSSMPPSPSEHTGEVVSTEWTRVVSHQRFTPVTLEWKEVLLWKDSGRNGEPPRWPELSVRGEDRFWRQESYIIRIQYESEGQKQVKVIEVYSEELYLPWRLGQQVSFTLDHGQVTNLRPR
jgi:hypothetical protein